MLEEIEACVFIYWEYGTVSRHTFRILSLSADTLNMVGVFDE